MNFSDDFPLVSVVLTTKNEEKHIEKCLLSIKCQSWENIEIILVDNYSNDRTIELAAQYTTQIYLKGPERSAQRNFGLIEKSRGTYGIYVDADMTLSPDLIRACVHKIRSHDDVVALHLEEKIYGERIFCKMRNFERDFYTGTSIDGVRFFDINIFKKIGGFDEGLFFAGSGEDWDLDKKFKRQGRLEVLRSPYAIDNGNESNVRNLVDAYIIHDESTIGLLQHYKKKLYYTKGFDGYITKWGRSDPDIQRQFGLYYRYWGVFVEGGKWKKILARPHLFLLLFTHKLIHGCIYLYGSRIRGK